MHQWVALRTGCAAGVKLSGTPADPPVASTTHNVWACTFEALGRRAAIPIFATVARARTMWLPSGDHAGFSSAIPAASSGASETDSWVASPPAALSLITLTTGSAWPPSTDSYRVNAILVPSTKNRRAPHRCRRSRACNRAPGHWLRPRRRASLTTLVLFGSAVAAEDDRSVRRIVRSRLIRSEGHALTLSFGLVHDHPPLRPVRSGRISDVCLRQMRRERGFGCWVIAPSSLFSSTAVLVNRTVATRSVPTCSNGTYQSAWDSEIPGRAATRRRNCRCVAARAPGSGSGGCPLDSKNTSATTSIAAGSAPVEV